MRRQLVLIAVPLCVVAIAASVAQAAPTHGEHTDDAKLDHLHAVRPDAASPTSSTTSSIFETVVAPGDPAGPTPTGGVAQVIGQGNADAGHDYLVSLYYGGVAAAAQQAAAAAAAQAAADAAAAAAAAASRSVSRAPVYSGSSPGGFLSCVRQRESGGDYSIHNEGGSGASGAYQMMPGTWNSIAASAGRPDLVGVDPAAASVSDQDAMAAALYAQEGASPWNGDAC
jgi:hypothetical protein